MKVLEHPVFRRDEFFGIRHLEKSYALEDLICPVCLSCLFKDTGWFIHIHDDKFKLFYGLGIEGGYASF